MVMKKRVLIVEDDPSVGQSLKQVLEGANYEVIWATDGQQGIDAFATEDIDLLILDINLPKKQGWDVFEEMTNKNPLIPIIVATGLVNQREVAKLAGVGALLEKPIEVPMLLQVMEELLVEPKENRLRRLCGHLSDTRYAPARTGVIPTKIKDYRPAAKPRQKCHQKSAVLP